jgi:chromosome segregation protein
MKLKSLEITGFKSFLEKTTVNFPPGISAIVGPNGCGKSNVVDAIKWVMGEQSIKQLRGKSMEDVIFAGSNGKPPLNMAEVSLTLANDNGSAPEELKDFTEIMLTRRLYRSGESAYFINKQPSRLKDIHNVFAGSGVGSKSYAMIQQGSIGAMIDAGPEERRFFLEEAAGITRYKIRKKEAVQKVQATNQNLLRLKDILEELRRQMAGLKRQAKKAGVFKNLQDRIKELDICLAVQYHDDYTRRIDQNHALLESLKDKDFEHIAEMKKLDAAVEEIKLKCTRKNQEISKQKSQKFQNQRNIDRMENDLEHLRNDLSRLDEEITNLESAKKELEEKKSDIEKEIFEVENQNLILKAQKKELTAEFEDEQSASQRIKDQLAELNQKLENEKAVLMSRVTQEARYKNIYQNNTNNKESLKRRLKRIDEEQVIASKNVKSCEAQETAALNQLNSYKEQKDELNKGIDIVRTQLEVKSRRLGRQVKIAQTLELQRNKARSKYTALKKMEDNFEWYKDGVRAIMKKRKENESSKISDGDFPDSMCDGIIGLMTDVIEPRPAYETAVEAVLGESLQYILIKDQETGLTSINYLQKQQAGRSGFIPVSSIKNLEFDGQKKPDPSKRLLNHVSVRPGFENIAEALLGHVVIAEDIEEARSVYNQNGVRQAIVTKDGHIISCQGIMVGGGMENLSGILAKKQELKKLHRQIDILDQKIEGVRHDQKQMEIEVRDLENELQKQIEHRNRTAQNEIEAEKSFYKATENLKNARRHLEIVCLEQEQLLGEELDIDEEIAKYNKALAGIEIEVKASKDSVTKISETIGAVSTEMENFNQKTVDLKLRMTALGAKLEHSDHTLKRLGEFLDDTGRRLQQVIQDVRQKNQKTAFTKQKIAEYEQTLSDGYDEIRHLEQELETNEAVCHEIEAELRNSDTIKSGLQGEREKTLQKIRILELEQSQVNMKRENLENRVEEQYHHRLSELKSASDKSSGTPISGEASIEKIEEELSRCRSKVEKFNDVNLGAIKEYEQLKVRFEFLETQRNDLIKAVDDLHKVIRKINKITQEKFVKAFDAVNEKIKEVFPRLFEGGSAKLTLTEPENLQETGVEFMIHPPGKKLTRMSLLSGGEKALAAIAFIFSIFLIKPTSFCIMDEIDAPLDEANVFRFNNLLKMIGEQSQVIMITHNKRSMEFADTLFGITMEKKGISKVVSVNLEHE